MSAGLQVFNTNGNLQLTQDYRNLKFIGKETISLTEMYDSGGAVNYKLITGFDASEIVAIRAVHPTINYPVNYVASVVQNGKYDIYFKGDVWWGPTNYTPIITYYRFSLTPQTSPGNHFEVYDAQGNLVFTDGSKYMKIIGGGNGEDSYISTPPSYPYPILKTINHSSSVSSAIVCGQMSVYYRYSGSNLTFIEQGFLFETGKVSSSYMAYGGYDAGGIGNSLEIEKNYNFMVLDVTGL